MEIEIRKPDAPIRTLARSFASHPAWVAAGRRIQEGAASRVFFSHRPGEEWHLVRRGGRTLLLPGPAPDPDFVFQFSPGAIIRLAAVEGGLSDFAIELCERIADTDGEARVGFRIVAPFGRLIRRGYLRVLLEAGPRIAAWGARRGVRTLSDLRRAAGALRSRLPEPWETAPQPRASPT